MKAEKPRNEAIFTACSIFNNYIRVVHIEATLVHPDLHTMSPLLSQMKWPELSSLGIQTLVQSLP